MNGNPDSLKGESCPQCGIEALFSTNCTDPHHQGRRCDACGWRTRVCLSGAGGAFPKFKEILTKAGYFVVEGQESPYSDAELVLDFRGGPTYLDEQVFQFLAGL
jgi:hypothetical protein